AQRNRARNKGVAVTVWPSARAPGSQTEPHPALARLLAEWLASKRMPAMHFLVEPQTLGRLLDRRVFVAEKVVAPKNVGEQTWPGGGGEPVGYLILSPIPARDGWLVEQIIQGRAAPNGTATLLLDAAMRMAAEAGSPYVTLGLSPLSQRAIETAPGVPHLDNPLWLQGLLGWVRAHGRRFYNFEGLETFKAKFVPDRWDAITAITREPAPSVGTLYAIADAFAGPRSPIGLVGRALARAVGDEARMLRQRFG
ncbi:MAG: phosphatidylglycerol lysyltransferase domain-containing protein, partial [Bacteroidota bacterium]